MVQQPAVQQPPCQGRRQTAPTVQIEAIAPAQARERQRLEGRLTGLEILEHLPEAGQATFGTRTDGLQQRQQL